MRETWGTLLVQVARWSWEELAVALALWVAWQICLDLDVRIGHSVNIGRLLREDNRRLGDDVLIRPKLRN